MVEGLPLPAADKAKILGGNAARIFASSNSHETSAPALALLRGGELAHAQYPQKPIRIIIGLGAGGVADGMTRTITDKITPGLGQPFVLENRPGAGGNIAMEAVIKAPADGHTLLLIGPALVINPALYPNSGVRSAEGSRAPSPPRHRTVRALRQRDASR